MVLSAMMMYIIIEFAENPSSLMTLNLCPDKSYVPTHRDERKDFDASLCHLVAYFSDSTWFERMVWQRQNIHLHKRL